MNPQQQSHYSLQSRLLVSFSLLLFVFLGLTGLVLDSAFRSSIEAGAEDRLQVQIYLLLAAADEEDGEFYFLEDLQEPKFNQLNSGLYGFISRPSLGELWRSDSARALILPDPQLLQQRVAVGQRIFTRATDLDDAAFFMLSYGILWEDGISEYSFSVMEDAAPYYSEISNFRNSLWYWLGGVAVLLLMMQFFLLRWVLSPLQRMAADLKKIESAGKDQLDSDYPLELQGVTENLNLLIESERKQQTRYRTTLGDLAHSLKTPLAVVTAALQSLNKNTLESQPEQLQEPLNIVEEQLDRMNQIVSYQLQRAVQSQQGSTLSRQVNVSSAINRVIAALTKVYSGKNMRCTTDMDNTAIFKGDERDLMEILGNILDNAFKYGSSQIRVTVKIQESINSNIKIRVDDDGPGIAVDKQEFVLQRGARADTLIQGQGIGLAVVTDIVKSYGGEITVGESDLKGARLTVTFKMD